MESYREHHPGLALAETVECFWTGRSEPGARRHRVFPDGCVDILYTRQGGRVSLEWIGTMTTWVDVTVSEPADLLGVRFRPGALGGRLPALVDQSAELQALDKQLAQEVLEGLEQSLRPGAILAVIQRLTARCAPRDAVSRALSYLEEQRGNVDLEWLAGQANLSERQFRRICEARTGLSPKRLARTLRFRGALALTQQAAPGGLTGVAYACGYADQAHFSHELRTFTGMTPSQVSDFYKPSSPDVP